MDWIEQWFGLSPDGGDGSVERLLLGAVAAVVVAIMSMALPLLRASLRRVLRRLVAAGYGLRPRA